MTFKKIVFLLSIFLFLVPIKNQAAADLINFRDTITNPRFSFRGQIAGTFSVGDKSVMIGTGQSDSDLKDLFSGDSVCFTDSGFHGCKGNTNYIVSSIPDQTGGEIILSSPLTTSLLTTDIAVSPQESTHVVTFTTADSVVNPVIQVRIPAADQTSKSNDGIPDYGGLVTNSGFDLNGLTTSDVSCMAGGLAWSAQITPSSSNGGKYHLITCKGTGTLSSGTSMTIVIGKTQKLINPAPINPGHALGRADIYNVNVREMDSSNNLIDESIVSVAPLEGVRVSASVPNALSFSITGIDSGTYCGKKLSVATTNTTVPFGQIASGKFYNAAQLLTVNTNNPAGYTVTAKENNSLSINGQGNVILPDAKAGDWTDFTNSGFGYSLSGSDASFQYSDFSRSFNARPFDKNLPQIIMTRNNPALSSNAYVCYQIATSNDQQAGFYLNQLTYTAVANF